MLLFVRFPVAFGRLGELICKREALQGVAFQTTDRDVVERPVHRVDEPGAQVGRYAAHLGGGLAQHLVQHSGAGADAGQNHVGLTCQQSAVPRVRVNTCRELTRR